VLISHGLNDFNTKPRHAARLWAALQAHHVPAKIWWHQGGHGDRPNAARQQAWRDMLNRFWTHHLFGVNNGAMDGPKAVIERENNEWVEYPTWPVPGAAPATLHLSPASEPNAIGRLGLSLGKPDEAAAEVIVDDASIDATALASAAQSPNRLVYRSEPLTAPVHVSGIPAVSLRLSFDKPAAIVSAMLVDYRTDGKAPIVTRGWADPQNRESLTKTTPIVPGTAYTVAFELQPHDYVFPAGSRIGLMLLSSDRQFTLRPPPGTRLSVQTARSTLVLPIVGGARAFASP
jgi:X-Pro dipeptidyl-peptidase